MEVLSSIVQVATAISLFAAAVAAILALREYGLKAAAERRETDIRVMQLFTQSVRIAQSRGGGHVSEKCIEKLFEMGIITKEDFDDLDNREKYDSLFNKLRVCAIAIPTSEASQDAAIAAIAVLAERYDILRQPAKAGLEAMTNHEGQKPQAEKALAHIKAVEEAEQQESTEAG